MTGSAQLQPTRTRKEKPVPQQQSTSSTEFSVEELNLIEDMVGEGIIVASLFVLKAAHDQLEENDELVADSTHLVIQAIESILGWYEDVHTDAGSIQQALRRLVDAEK